MAQVSNFEKHRLGISQVALEMICLTLGQGMMRKLLLNQGNRFLTGVTAVPQRQSEVREDQEQESRDLGPRLLTWYRVLDIFFLQISMPSSVK